MVKLLAQRCCGELETASKLVSSFLFTLTVFSIISKEMSRWCLVHLMQGACLSSISASALEACQQLLDGIHFQSLSFHRCLLHGGNNGLHLTQTSWMNVTLIAFLDKCCLKLKLHCWSFSFCTQYTHRERLLNPNTKSPFNQAWDEEI